MSVDVRFRLYVPPRGWVEEDQKPLDSAAAAAAFAERSRGAVVIRGHGQEELELEDSLAWLAMHLSGRCVAEAIEIGRCVVAFFSSTETVEVAREGEVAVVTPEDGAARRYPAGELLPALLRCGERIQALFAGAGNEVLHHQAAQIEPELEGARKALASAGLLGST